ncbi:MAG TPA: PaaI family thioesterase [Acidimicrobiia bacterium]
MALSPDEQRERRAFLRSSIVRTRYIGSLGIVVERWDEDAVQLRLPFDAALTNDGSAFHGGAIASLMDTTGASAVWAGHDFDKGTRAATVTMTINYLGAAQGTDLVADAVCVKRGRELSFAEVRVHDPDGKPVATGTLVYRIVP